jgi:hypothetical protein
VYILALTQLLREVSVTSSALFFIHFLSGCPLYTNARIQLFINITLYTVISIENLLFGSDNLTDEKQFNSL